jgi:small conductance mechanosensitive channel
MWDMLQSIFGIGEQELPRLAGLGLQIVVVTGITVLIARWLGDWIQRAAWRGRTYAEAASLVSRAVSLGLYAIGAAIILSLLGVNSTAIAAILGAATFGISLALQDVSRSFVNGVYILIERPFRIGDRIRIGSTEGRVEEIGVRLTRLRTERGDHIVVPNTVVFSSVVESGTSGQLDRERFTISKITSPVSEIEPAISAALKGTPHLGHQGPRIEVIETSPDGTTVEVTIEHDLGHQVRTEVIGRLAAALPEATVRTGIAAPAQ